MTNRITALELKRDTGVQQPIKIVTGSVPVSFFNRAGAPTVYFMGPAGPEFDDKASIVLVSGANAVPDHAKYIGSAEFSGGQAMLHAFIVRKKS